jgi:hypothetical protein
MTHAIYRIQTISKYTALFIYTTIPPICFGSYLAIVGDKHKGITYVKFPYIFLPGDVADVVMLTTWHFKTNM